MNRSKYTPEFIKKVDEYLKECKDKRREFHKVRGIKSNSYQEKYDVNLPTIYGFATYISFSEETVHVWKREHPEFKAALKKILAEQQKRLIDGGLSNRYNPVVAKLLLSANHGMKERVDKTTKDQPIKQSNYTDEQIEKIADRIAKRQGKTSDPSS